MLFCFVTFNLWLHYNKLLTYLLYLLVDNSSQQQSRDVVYKLAILTMAISVKRAFPMLRYFSLSISTSEMSPQPTDRNE